MELDESNITHESTLAMLRQKHNSSISEMGDQIDSLNKLKAKAEKERNGVALELEEAQNQMGNEQNERQNLEKQGKVIQQQIYDAQGRLEELQRALHEADGSKRKITVENCDLVHQFEEAERAAASLSKDRSSLTTQLEDAKRLADAETRERINLLGKMRNLQHELEVMKEHLEEEAERNAASLSKDRSSLTTQLEDAKRLADAETRERINLLGKMRNLQHELEVMKEHLEEEAERNAASLSKDRSSLTTQLEDAKRLADAETRERINLLGKMRNLQHEVGTLILLVKC